MTRNDNRLSYVSNRLLPLSVRWSRLGMLLCLAMLSGCGGPWRDTYLNKGVHKLTQADIEDKFGPPSTAKTPVLGGDTVWTYRVPMGDREVHPWDPSSLAAGKKTKAPPSPSPFGKSLAGNDEPYREPLYCYRYTLSFDEQKRLKDWKREECVPRTSEDGTVVQ
ncbi:MAG TPA: hypothetical protein PLY42_10695 [Nitrospira sp.]|nr:hypothetical protein [Nitrospira sp.]MCW5794202.1 hypothetical protein [Nitrospira sp.]HMU29207.1 hypothetical protein [Nitrospira sp.]HMV56625.1 hypothetical protein [Nitrospira sp.]HMX91825.1 hypothetical protein [Nitrospira sp.]